MIDIPFFKCPKCSSSLTLGSDLLRCRECGTEYHRRDGVLDFSGLEATYKTERTTSQFGESWKIFDHIEPYHEKQFFEWIYPITSDDFKDKAILEAGCGKGRHTMIVSSYGPRSLYAVDLSEAVFITRENTKNLENITLLRSDIKNLPLNDSTFDLVFSAGVLHHIDKPKEGLDELWRVLKPGGKLLLWVYAREGNGWIIYFVNPLRKTITSKIPTRFLRILSFPLTAILYALLKLIYSPLTDWGAKESPLFYSSYLGAISPFPFREIDNIVVDHLCPPVAYYLSRKEIEAMFEHLGPLRLEFRWHHKNSWTVLAVKGNC